MNTGEPDTIMFSWFHITALWVQLRDPLIRRKSSMTANLWCIQAVLLRLWWEHSTPADASSWIWRPDSDSLSIMTYTLHPLAQASINAFISCWFENVYIHTLMLWFAMPKYLIILCSFSFDGNRNSSSKGPGSSFALCMLKAKSTIDTNVSVYCLSIPIF